MSMLEKFNKAVLSVDNVIFGFDEGDLKILLIKRGEEPYSDLWALPGHYVYGDEDLDAAARRVLLELTGLENVFLEQVKAFGKVGRHPFGRVVTIAYFSLIKIKDYKIQASSMARVAEWHAVDSLDKLAFDHNDILGACFQQLKLSVKTRPIGFELLPPKFTLTELQYLYESILRVKLDKRNFRKKILSMNVLIDLDEIQDGVAHRPARLYQFDQERYKKFREEGYVFEVKEGKRLGV
ncbi:MAG: NUDIX hydrolase [Saprospiraceae bacterium]